MNRRSINGGMRFPVFLLMVSAGLVLAVGQFHVADAAMMTPSPIVAARLAEVPRMDDTEALGEALERALQGAEALNGDWQPPAPEQHPPAPDLQPPPGVAQAQPTPEARGLKDPFAAVPDVSGSVASPSELAAARLSDAPVADTTLPESAEKIDAAEPAPVGVHKSRVKVRYSLLRVKQEARRNLTEGGLQAAYLQLRAAVDEGGADDVEFLGLLALAALQVGRPGEASVVYERLVELQPDSERWWAGLAMAQEKLGLDAEPVYRHLLSLSTEDSPLKRLVRDKIGALG